MRVKIYSLKIFAMITVQALIQEPGVLCYHSGLSRWFLVPEGAGYKPIKPSFLPKLNGIKINGSWIQCVISTCSFYDIHTTNADAVFANFLFYPGKEKPGKILQLTRKPVIISVPHIFVSKPGLQKIATELENSGAAGLYTGPYFPVSELKKICSSCSVPVFSFSGTKTEEIKFKVNSGIFALCFSAKNITKSLITEVRNLFPAIKIVAVCGRSEKFIVKFRDYGIDAIFFKPCVPYKMDWGNF